MTTRNYKLIAVCNDPETNASVMRIGIGFEPHLREFDLPISLQYHPDLLRDKLADLGAIFSPERSRALKEVVTEIVSKLQAADQLVLWGKTGWTESDLEFVLPDKTISIGSSDVVYSRSDSVGEIAQVKAGGNAEESKKVIGELAAKSNYIIFAVALALAGPLLKQMDESENPIVNFWSQDSSTGKSTLLLAFTSVYQRAMRNEMMTFASTQRGWEEAAATHNHLGLAIDELGQADDTILTKKGMRKSAMIISSGRGNVRTGAIKGRLPNLSWLAVFVTAGNRPVIPNPEAEKESDPTAVRWIDCKVPGKDQFGILDKVQAGDLTTRQAIQQNAQFVEDAERRLSKHYGHLGRRWIKHLVYQRKTVKKAIDVLMQEFRNKELTNVTNTEWRIAKKFALVGAIAQYAARKKFVGWSEDEGLKAATVMYSRYKRDLGKCPDTHAKAADMLLIMIGAKDGFQRFSAKAWRGQSAKPSDADYGFTRQEVDGTSTLWLNRDQLPRLSKALGLRENQLAQILRDNDLISLSSENKMTRLVALPWNPKGSRVRMVMIKMRVLRAFVNRQRATK